MTHPTLIATLMPAIDSLAKCLERVSIDYQKLFSNDENYPLNTEAGRTLRHLSSCYAKVLCAALEYPYDDIDSDEDWFEADQDDDDSLD